MKKIIILSVVVFCFINKTFATDYTWTLTTSGNANSAASWAPAGIPGAADNVIFDGTSTTNCTWDIGSIGGFSVMAGYTGVISMTSLNKNIRNNLVINSGTLIATSAILTKQLTGTGSVFILGAGGVFNHNSGTFLLQLDAGDNYTFSGNIILNNLDLGAAFSTGERFIDFGSNLTANNVSFSHFFTPDPISFQGNIHIKTGLDLSSNTNTGALIGTHTGNFIFDGASATITGASAANISRLPNIEMNVTGNYSISGHLSISGNWVHTQGTLTAGTSTENFYGSSATITGAGASFDNLTVQTGATVNMPSSEVRLSGSLSMLGTLNFQTTSALGLIGTGGTQSIGLGGKTLAAINAYGTGSRAVTLSGAIDILDSIKVESGVTLNTGGALTLKSNASRTARVAESNGTISGNVTVETFIPGLFTGWANLGVRGVTGQLVANWDTYVSSGQTNGIPMTCVGCAFEPTVMTTPFTSVQSWNESTSDYSDLTSTSPMNPGVGRWVYVGNGTSTTSDLTLINTGALAQGPISVPVTDGGSGADQGFNLVANPYPSPISLNRLMNDPFANNGFDFQQTIYIWNTDEFSGSGTYVSTNGSGITTPVGYNVDVIAGGQGFYIEYEPQVFFPGVLNFTESMKVDNSTEVAVLLKSTTTNTLSYFRLKLGGGIDGDETVISINQNATELYDGKYDSKKILQTPGYVGYPGNYTHYTTISSKDANGKDYSINTLPTLTKNSTVPIMVRVSSSGTYTISSFDFNNFENCLVLIDKLDNSYHDLRVAPYVFTISDTTSAPRFELVLCKNQSDVITAISEVKGNNSSISINQDQQGAYVKTDFAQNTKATISVFNIMGQKLMEDIEVEGTVTNTRLNLNLNNQVVFIRVVSEKENTSKKIILR